MLEFMNKCSKSDMYFSWYSGYQSKPLQETQWSERATESYQEYNVIDRHWVTWIDGKMFLEIIQDELVVKEDNKG